MLLPGIALICIAVVAIQLAYARHADRSLAPRELLPVWGRQGPLMVPRHRALYWPAWYTVGLAVLLMLPFVFEGSSSAKVTEGQFLAVAAGVLMLFPIGQFFGVRRIRKWLAEGEPDIYEGTYFRKPDERP